MLKALLPYLTVLSIASGCFAAKAESFRFHLLGEPHSLDAQTNASNSGNYIFHNLFRGLYRLHGKKGLLLEGAKSCGRTPLRLTCRLNPNHHWSNGERIVAEDYVRAFQHLADPERKSPQTEIILSLKNARKILKGELAPDKIGVRALASDLLRFDFSEEDPEFEYRLINAAAAPFPKSGLPTREKASTLVTSGPYQIKEWKIGTRISLAPNLNYGLPANPNRPELEALIIENDPTALRLYESGRLNFLRRVNFGDIARYKASPEFHQFQMSRFDYVGFAGTLATNAALREAISTAIDFSTFKNLTDNDGVPGCPGLPERLLDRAPCVKFNVEQARLALSHAGVPPKLEFYFSRMGGDDIAQTVEWLQGQWKKNLGILVELKGEEQSVYLQHLRVKPPSIFRKGISLDRPTCLAALEIFTRGNAENFMKISDDAFEKLVKNLSTTASAVQKKTLCRRAIHRLIDTHQILPLGKMYFSVLAKERFQGWDLNELNQLDLTDLVDTKEATHSAQGLGD